jgi:hypothetical protein
MFLLEALTESQRQNCAFWRKQAQASICITKFHGRPRSARASQHKRRLEAGRWQSPFKSQPLHIYGEIAGRDPIALSTVVKK